MFSESQRKMLGDLDDWMDTVTTYMRYRIKFERQMKDLSPDDIAESFDTRNDIGIHRDTVLDIENGKSAFPRLDSLLKICYALQLSPQRLFEHSAGVKALVRFEVLKQPDKLAKAIRIVNGVEYTFCDGKEVITMVRFSDTDALGAFLLDFTTILVSHVKKTITNVVIREYMSPLIPCPLGEVNRLLTALAMYAVEFDNQDKLANRVRLQHYVDAVMAVAGVEDIFVILRGESRDELNLAIKRIENIKGLTRKYLAFNDPSNDEIGGERP